MTLGQRIRQTRIRRGLTQSQIAMALGVTEANISNYERDKSIPPSERLQKLAEVLGVSVDYLLGRTNDPHGYSQDAGEDEQLRDAVEFITRARDELSEEAYTRFLELTKQLAEAMKHGNKHK
ncbi:helix-turn-helix domain-containing protein [Alicyclobacillus sendaiensis]|uniref:helix-turn-helix domain-containing protein n=1 Tax=Alicyclobacillus sendaiensis TaxID=192387 RepID=UPI0026F41190|nr:helix-turn-helix domain-containing protein [Alicyclobacillus sendaiensis]